MLALLVAAAVVLPPDPPPAPAVPRWYGDQTLIADGVSAGVMLAGFGLYEVSSAGSTARSIGNGVGRLGMAGLFFATPVLHLGHDNPRGALGSVSGRVGCTLLGATLGAIFGAGIRTDPTREWPSGTAAGTGAAIGASVMMLFQVMLDAQDRAHSTR